MKYSLLSLFAALLVISCAAPLPISKLNPSENDIAFWNNGREVLAQSKDSIYVEVSFYEKRDNIFVFDVTIANEKNESVMIDPLRFSYIPISEQGDTLSAIRAINPEKKILEEQKNISRLDAERKNELTGLLVLGSLEIASELTNGDDHESDYYTPSSFDIYHREVAEIDFSTMTSMDLKRYWENQTLRKTTLFSDHFTSGQVLLSYKKDISKVGLRLNIDNLDFEFWFTHSLIPVRK